MAPARPVDRLVEQCIAAQFDGADFPTIWKTILRKNSLVAGTPVQMLIDGHPGLSVRLTTNQQLVFGPGGWSLG